MRVRLQADADLDQAILFAVIRHEPAIQSAVVAGLANRSDMEVLGIAAAEGRVLVTHDRKTMPLHFAQFISHEMRPGVIIVSKRLPISKVADDLLLVWGASEAEEWTNRIIHLPL
ncbi:MAG TPA: DUF5615 family PIN-like protein [Pirellulales bacterium]|nr:DUF5615 family PIN-like protein [Pirellulales bacterium]